MGPLCREKYDEFPDQAMLELENMEVVDGTLSGVNLIRAQQIMGHPETMGLAKDEVTGKDKLIHASATECRPMLVLPQLQTKQQHCDHVLAAQGKPCRMLTPKIT